MSDLQKDIDKWKKITELQETSGDRVTCPECKDQVAFCDCPQRLAQEILTKLVEDDMIITEDKSDTKPVENPLNRFVDKTSTLDEESGITTNHYKYRSILNPKVQPGDRITISINNSKGDN